MSNFLAQYLVDFATFLPSEERVKDVIANASRLTTGLVAPERLAPNPLSTKVLFGNNTWGDISGALPPDIVLEGDLAAIAFSGSASDLITGTVPLLRLPSQVARTDLSNTFSLVNTFNGGIRTSASSGISFSDGAFLDYPDNSITYNSLSGIRFKFDGSNIITASESLATFTGSITMRDRLAILSTLGADSAILELPSWEPTSVTLSHGSFSSNASQVAVRITNAGQLNLNSASGQNLNLATGGVNRLTLNSTVATFSGNISAASATFSNVLSLGINQWHTDTNGAQRLYYWGADRTIIKGYGPTPIEFRNAADNTLAYYSEGVGWFLAGTVNPGNINFPANVWMTATDGLQRLYYTSSGTSLYRGHGSIPHEFRNGANGGLVRISDTGNLSANGVVTSGDITGTLGTLGSLIAYGGRGHLALYGNAGGTGAQVYLGDSNFSNSSYWNSAPGIGAVGGSPTSELAFYVYTGAVNSRTEAGRFKTSLGLQIGGTSGNILRSSGNSILVRNNADGAGANLNCFHLYTEGTIQVGGDTGPIWRNNSGSLQARNAANNDYSNVSAGNFETNSIEFGSAATPVNTRLLLAFGSGTQLAGAISGRGYASNFAYADVIISANPSVGVITPSSLTDDLVVRGQTGNIEINRGRLIVTSSQVGNTLQATYTNTSSGQPAGFRLSNSGWDIGFRTNPSNGWFEITDSAGNIQHRWNAKDYLIASDGRLYFSSQTNFATAGIGAQDVSIGRASAGILRVYNSAGADGSIQAANGTFSGTVQVGSGPILQNSAGVLDIRNSTNTAWTRLRADEYWLQGNSFSRVAQLNTSSGGWVGGYNINYNGNIVNRDSTGPVSGIAYESESVRFYTALSDVPGPISTTSMSLSPTNLTVNTGNIVLSSTSALYFGTDFIPTISTGPNYTVSNEWYVMFAGAHYFGGASTTTFVVFDTNRADFNRPIRLSSTGPTLKNSSGALQVRDSGDTAFANLEAANGTFSGNVTGTWTGNAVGILYGGTGATTAQGARTNLLPSQTGNSGRVLTTNGTDVSWTAVGTGGVGDVIGPVSSTDNAIVRYDGTTGKLIQNSSATIDDSGNASFTGFVNITTGSSVSQGLRLNSSTSTLGRTASLFIGYPGYYDDNLMILHNSAPAIAISDSSVQSFRNFGLLGAVRQLSHIDNGNNTIIYNSSGNPGVQISALTRMIFGVNLTEQISLTSSLLTVTPNTTFSGTVQVGASGPLLKNNSGTLQVRDSGDTGYANLEARTGVFNSGSIPLYVTRTSAPTVNDNQAIWIGDGTIASSIFFLRAGGGGGAGIGYKQTDSTGHFSVYSGGGGGLITLDTGSGEAMRVVPSMRVLIGTTTDDASSRLQVKGSIAIERADTSDNVVVINSPSWDNTYFAIRHGGLAETAANTTLSISGAGQSILNSASGQPLNLRIGNSDTLTITSGRSIQQPTGIWHGDLGGLARYFYASSSTSYYRGHGSLPHEWRNSADGTIMTLSSAGLLNTSGDIVSGTIGGSRIQIVAGGGAQSVSEFFSTEANPRWSIGRDIISGGVSGLAFGFGAIQTTGSGIGSPSTGRLSFYTTNGTSLTERAFINNSGVTTFNAGIGVGATPTTQRLLVNSTISGGSLSYETSLVSSKSSVDTSAHFRLVKTGISEWYLNHNGGGSLELALAANLANPDFSFASGGLFVANSQVKLGNTSGVRLKNNSGMLQVRNDGDSAFAPMQAGVITTAESIDLIGSTVGTGNWWKVFAQGNVSGGNLYLESFNTGRGIQVKSNGGLIVNSVTGNTAAFEVWDSGVQNIVLTSTGDAGFSSRVHVGYLSSGPILKNASGNLQVRNSADTGYSGIFANRAFIGKQYFGDTCYSFSNGYLIATDIPATADRMIEFTIEGNTYDNAKGPSFTRVQAYNYNSGPSTTIINQRGMSTDKDLTFEMFHYNGFVYAWFTQTSLFQTYTIKLISPFADHIITSITNAAKPTVGVTNSVTVPMLQWWNQANDGTGSGMDADLLDGQHGSYYATASSVAGTLNYVPKFTSSSAIGNSQIFDDGTNVGIGTTTLTHKLTVNGTASFGGGVSAGGGTVSTGGNNNYALLQIGSAADPDAFRIIQAGNWWLGPTENVGLHLQTNGSTRLTIANNGNSVFSNDLSVSGNLQTNGTFTATNGYSYLYGAAIQQPADGPSVQMNPGRLSIGGAVAEISIQDRDAADNTFRSVLYSNGGLFRVWRGTDRFTVSSTATTVIDQLNVNSGIVRLGTSTNPEVGPGTSDGSDNRILLLVGGGAYGPTTRGAHISVHGLDSATRPGNIELWAGQNGDIRLGGEQGGGHTIALTVRPNGSLRHRTNVWHQDDTGANRYYYTNNGTTFYSGQGATAHIFRNGSDVNLVSIDQNGLLVTQGTNSGIDTLDRVSGERWVWYGSGGIARLFSGVAAADLLLITNTGNTTFGNSILFDRISGNPRIFSALPMTYQVNLNTGVQHNFFSANGASFTSGDIVRISGSAGYPDTVNMLSIHNSSGVSSFNVKQDGRIGSNMEGVSLSNISVAPFLTSARVGVNIFDYGVLGNNVNQSAFNVSYMGGSLSGVLAPVTNDYRNILTFRTGGTSAALSNTPSFAIRCTIGSTIGSSMSDVITDFMTTSTATGTTISKIKIQANTNTVDIPQGQLTIFEGSNYTRIERTSNGRLTVYRPNDVSTPAVSFGGGNDEIQIRSGLGLIAHSGANFSVIAPSGGGTLTLGSTSSNVFISAGGGAPTITSTATNHYLRAPDGTAFLYANSTSATTEGLMYWGNSTSHGGVALAAIQSSLGRIGYLSWYKPNGTRQGYFGYDNGNDITLTNEVGGNFAVNTGIYAATRVRVGTNSLNEFDLELDNYGRARVTTATAVGWLSRNSLSEWGAQVSAGGDWEVMQYSPSIFRRLWVTQAGEVYTQNQISSASAVGNVTLDIRAITSQTGRLLRFLNSSSSEIGFVTPSGDASFNGSLGIGNTSPLFKAQITGSFNAGDGTFLNTNANSQYFFDGNVSYYHIPGAMIRKDSSATVPADILATLVLYNRNGTNNTGSKLAFVSNETTSTSANAVTTAAIVSQKVSGNDGGWATGNLKFLIKSASTYVEAMTIDASGRVGIGADPIANTRLYVKESGSSTTTWRGRIVAGGDNVAFLMGEYNSQAWLGAHNAALNAWQVLKINPDGNQELHLGNFGSAGAAPILTLANSTGVATFSNSINMGNSSIFTALVLNATGPTTLRFGYAPGGHFGVVSDTSLSLRSVNNWIANSADGSISLDAKYGVNIRNELGVYSSLYTGTVQLNGTSGPILQNNSGFLEVRNSGNTDYNPIRSQNITITNPAGGSFASPASGRLDFRTQGISYLAGSISGRSYTANSIRGDVVISANPNVTILDYSNLSDDLVVRGDTGNVEIGRGSFITANSRTYGLTRTLPSTVGDFVEIGSFAFTNGAGLIEVFINVGITSNSQTKHYIIPVQYHGTSANWRKIPANNSSASYAGNDFDLEVNTNNGVTSLRVRKTAGTVGGTIQIHLKHIGTTNDDFTPTTGTGSTGAPTALSTEYYRENLIVRAIGGSTQDLVTLQNNVGTTVARITHAGQFTMANSVDHTSLADGLTRMVFNTSGTTILRGHGTEIFAVQNTGGSNTLILQNTGNLTLAGTVSSASSFMFNNSPYFRAAQLVGSTGIVGGYNIEWNGSSVVRNATGTVSGYMYSSNTVNFYAEPSAAPAALTPKMILSDTLLSVARDIRLGNTSGNYSQMTFGKSGSHTTLLSNGDVDNNFVIQMLSTSTGALYLDVGTGGVVVRPTGTATEIFRILNTGAVRFIKDVNHQDSDGLARFIFNNAASTSLRGYSSTPFRLFNASNSEIVSIGQTGIITAGIPFADSKNGTVPTTLYVQNLFNNMGLAHSSVTDFNSINDFGFRYVQGSTNGPGTGSSQFYNITLGLGIDYNYSSFALQLAIPRFNSSDKYLSMRTRESGAWGSWQKIAAGTADGLREFTWSGKPAATSTKGPIMITDTVPANTIWTSDGSVWRSQTRTRKVITYAATLTLDSSEAMVQRITLTGNLTLNKFTNGFDGASLEVLLRQDGTGGRTLTFGTGFRFNDYITSITLSTGANKTDRILFEYDAIDDVWDVISFVKGS